MASQTESERVLKMDLSGENRKPYGFRIRCRVCNQEDQANLTSQATTFIEKHEKCQEDAWPQL